MQAQEIFDKVLSHLRQQGVRAINEETGSCVYRGKNNTMCAVGCLIPDHLYDPEIEGAGVVADIHDREQNDRVFKLHAILEKVGIADHLFLLEELQRVHDSGMFNGLKSFEIGMKLIAEEFHLIYTPPSTEDA